MAEDAPQALDLPTLAEMLGRAGVPELAMVGRDDVTAYAIDGDRLARALNV